jgi:hypothetical protein
MLGLQLSMPALQVANPGHPSQAWGLRLVVCVAVLAPLVHLLPDLRRAPVATLRHLSTSFTCFCGLLVPSWVSGVLALTGVRYEIRSTCDPAERRRWRISQRGGTATNFFVGRAGSLAVELLAAPTLVATAILTVNWFLLSVAIGMLVAPVADLLGWEHPVIAQVRHLPFVLLGAQLIALTLPGAGASGLTSQLLMIHF